MGITPYDIVSAPAAFLVYYSSNNSYAKSSQYAIDSQVSRQTVMNKTRKVDKCHRRKEIDSSAVLVKKYMVIWQILIGKTFRLTLC